MPLPHPCLANGESWLKLPGQHCLSAVLVPNTCFLLSRSNTAIRNERSKAAGGSRPQDGGITRGSSAWASGRPSQWAPQEQRRRSSVPLLVSHPRVLLRYTPAMPGSISEPFRGKGGQVSQTQLASPRGELPCHRFTSPSPPTLSMAFAPTSSKVGRQLTGAVT